MSNNNRLNDDMSSFSDDLAGFNQFDTKEGLLSFPFDHIYACKSESEDRSHILHLDKDLEISSHCIIEDTKNIVIRPNPEVIQLTESLNSYKEQNRRLKDLLIYHLDLVQHQYNQLSKKDKAFYALRQENELLQEKLCRLDRRVVHAIPTAHGGLQLLPSLPALQRANPPPLVHMPPPAAPPPVKNVDYPPPQQVVLNNFSEVLIQGARPESFVIKKNPPRTFSHETLEVNRRPERNLTATFIPELTLMSIVDTSKLKCQNVTMINGKRAFIRKETTKSEPLSEAIYTFTTTNSVARSTNMAANQKNKKRQPVVTPIVRSVSTTKTTVTSTVTHTTAKMSTSKPNTIFKETKPFERFTVNKKPKPVNTYGKNIKTSTVTSTTPTVTEKKSVSTTSTVTEKKSVSTTPTVTEKKSVSTTPNVTEKKSVSTTPTVTEKKSVFATGSLSSRLQLMDPIPSGQDPYQLGEAEMREQSPIRRLMLQKSHRMRISTIPGDMANNTGTTQHFYESAAVEKDKDKTNKPVKAKPSCTKTSATVTAPQTVVAPTAMLFTPKTIIPKCTIVPTANVPTATASTAFVSMSTMPSIFLPQVKQELPDPDFLGMYNEAVDTSIVKTEPPSEIKTELDLPLEIKTELEGQLDIKTENNEEDALAGFTFNSINTNMALLDDLFPSDNAVMKTDNLTQELFNHFEDTKPPCSELTRLLRANLHDPLSMEVSQNDPILDNTEEEEETTLTALESMTLTPLDPTPIDTSIYTQLDSHIYTSLENSLYAPIYMQMMTPIVSTTVTTPVATSMYMSFVTSTVTSVASSITSTTTTTMTADELQTLKGRKRAQSATGDSDSESLLIPKKQRVKRRSRSRKPREKQSPVPGVMVPNPYDTSLGDPDSFWYFGAEPEIKFECSSDDNAPEPSVEVPRWREMPYSPISSEEGIEPHDDRLYEKMHQKVELEERRQLRWHMRRLREQRHVERLRQRQRDPSWLTQTTKSPSVPSLWPQPQSDLRLLEVTYCLPLCAFGEDLPDLPEVDFVLPWVRSFKPIKRYKRSRTLQ